MGAALYRFHPTDFRMKTAYGKCLELEDWPYQYEDLEPYYSRAEWAIGVSGAEAKNPFEGFRSAPFPLSPLAANPVASYLDAACLRLGLHPFPTPRAINSLPYRGRPGCAYCSMCGGHGCPVGARGSTQETLLADAERTGHCQIKAKSMVREITVGEDGLASGCLYLDQCGIENKVNARIVCVCCSAVESARLLLMSRSRLFPDGLANCTGLVGRYLQFHAASGGRAWLRHDRNSLPPTRNGISVNYFLGRSVMDFYFLPSKISELPKGGILRFDLMRPNPIGIAQRLAHDSEGNLLWGNALKQRLQEYFLDGLEIEFEVFHDFLPNKDTFVELDPDIRDKWGLPVARMHLMEPEHHRKAGSWLVEQGLQILEIIERQESKSTSAIGETCRTMVHGTCRAGTNPKSSVLNNFCQAHEVPNLFVVDGSFMPTSGGAPSTLTILANSFRTADYILDMARKGEI